MARIGRLAGAIIVESEDHYFLVGDTKEPCDFPKHGFATPDKERLVTEIPFIPLEGNLNGEFPAPYLQVPLEGEVLLKKLVTTFLIYRNGSISERLWGLVLESSDLSQPAVDASWLATLPEDIWDVVRDTLLRC